MANRSPKHKCICAFVAALYALMALAGCARAPLFPYALGEPPLVSLPAAAAGVRDGRSNFARHFAAELAFSNLTAEPNVGTWIHWPTLPIVRSESTSPLDGVSVLVISGIFGDCVSEQALPFSDGIARSPASNLTEGYSYLAASGLARVRAINVRGRVASSVNGEVIANAILQEAEDSTVSRIVLVGYSKGVADALHALERIRISGLPQQPLSFVSLSGAVLGTPIADAHETLYGQLATQFEGLTCTPSDGNEVASLTRRERVRWLASHPLPHGVNLYSVVAYTGAESVSPGLRPFYRLLAQTDLRNDGQVLSSDAVLPNSTLLAEVNSDHWTYVLPLRNHPKWFIRAAAADLPYPRAEFFMALLRTVVEMESWKEGMR